MSINAANDFGKSTRQNYPSDPDSGNAACGTDNLAVAKGTIVVALGGNAISPSDEIDSIPNQFEHVSGIARRLVRLVQDGWTRMVVTHGNGPQVGNAVTRVEMAREATPWLPLFICVADIQGGMGYMIQQCLDNALAEAGVARRAVTVVTQVIVDREDPAFERPSKPIGPGKKLVASPLPRSIAEADVIRRLVEDGFITIAGGGGGVPVIEEGGRMSGVEAVIDKDLTAALIAREIGARRLLILTDVDAVYTGFGTQGQRRLEEVTARDLRGLIESKEFPSGSMGPKAEAVCSFVENGGELAVIASLDDLDDAIEGRAGTRVQQ